MAQYNPTTFGPISPQKAIELYNQWAASHGGAQASDNFTVAYVAGGTTGHQYVMYFFESSVLTFTGTEYTSYASNSIRCYTRMANFTGMYNESTDSYTGWSGSGNYYNSYAYLHSIAGQVAWESANLFSTIEINCTDAPAYDYDPTLPEADFVCTKDPYEYLIHLGVKATPRSDYIDYAYRTKSYQIHLKWTSPVTGLAFDIPLTGLTEYTAHYTRDALTLKYNFSYTSDAGSYARALRTPVGSYDVLPPLTWEDLTPVNSVKDVSLSELKAAAQTQQAGVVNDDLFTIITCEFMYNNAVVYSGEIDYSSLLGEDIDITGGTVPDPNSEPSLADDNLYTDKIELTEPSLTATGVFNRCYVMDGNGVNDLCNYLYNANDSIFDEIIDGVLTRGAPIESLIDLRLYPFDVRAFTGAGTAEAIKFGRTNTGIIGVKLPHDASAVISLGGCTVPRYYKNFLDYKMSAQLYIPFCGMVDLPIDRILNHKISVKLIVDYITGAGCAVVYVDDLPFVYQQGVIGVSIPMTATNSAEFGKTIAGNLIQTATTAATGDLSSAADSALSLADSLYSGSHIQKIGSSSPQVSLFQPKNAYILLSIVTPAQGVYDDEFADSVGYACFMPVSTIGIASGYCVFDKVKLDIPQATEQERDMINDLLTSGVYL